MRELFISEGWFIDSPGGVYDVARKNFTTQFYWVYVLIDSEGIGIYRGTYEEWLDDDYKYDMANTVIAFASNIDDIDIVTKHLSKSQADEVIKQLEEKYAKAKQEIDSLNLPTKEFLFTQAYTVNQAPTFRLFTKNSMVSHVLEAVGLENTITDNLEADWGFIEANIEGVSNYQEAILIHAVQEDDPLFDNMKNNKVWNDLTFVKENQLYDIGGDTWTFGGVLSADNLVNNLLAAIKE